MGIVQVMEKVSVYSQIISALRNSIQFSACFCSWHLRIHNTGCCQTKEASVYPKLMTVKEVADLLRVAPSTVYKMVADGDVDFVRYGSVIRIKPESLGITEMLPVIVA